MRIPFFATAAISLISVSMLVAPSVKAQDDASSFLSKQPISIEQLRSNSSLDPSDTTLDRSRLRPVGSADGVEENNSSAAPIAVVDCMYGGEEATSHTSVENSHQLSQAVNRCTQSGGRAVVHER